MFEIKNAFKNVKRNSKRYVIVAILIFIISFISVIALIVNQSAQTTIESYLNEYGTSATIDVDPEQMRSSFEEGSTPSTIENLTYDDYELIAQSEYVESVSYEQSTAVYSDEVTAVESEMPQGKMDMVDTSSTLNQTTSFTLVGSDDLANSSYFADDTNVIISGDYPTADNEIIINSDLLENNDITVGDELVFEDSTGEVTATLKVVGIYESVTQNQMMMNSSNMIFASYNTISGFTSEKTNITATFELTSYEVVEEFENDLYANGLDEMYYVNNNQQLLEQIIGPVESTMQLLNTLMIIVFIVGGAILIFINLLILRERKYEIGVMRAIGASKARVVLGLMMEAVIVAFIAMFISLVAGVAVAQPVSDMLISNASQTKATPNTENNMGMPSDAPGNDMKSDGNSMRGVINAVDTINATMNLKVLFMTFLINLILIGLTTIVSSRFITRQQPNEILREN